jgi:hypothetical protein
MLLDADLQDLLVKVPNSPDFELRLLNIQEDRTRNRGLAMSAAQMLESAGSTQSVLIESIFLTLAANYMKPSNVNVTQTDESMDAECMADAKRLRKAAYQVFDQMRQAKAAW